MSEEGCDSCSLPIKISQRTQLLVRSAARFNPSEKASEMALGAGAVIIDKDERRVSVVRCESVVEEMLFIASMT